LKRKRKLQLIALIEDLRSIMAQKFFIAALSLFWLIAAPAARSVEGASAARVAFQQTPDQPSEAEQSMFRQGQTLYNRGRYEQAAIVFNNLLRNYPNSSIADLTLLWIGRSYLQLGNLAEAERTAQRLRAYGDSPFVEVFDGELRAARRDGAKPSATMVNEGLENRTRTNTMTNARTAPSNSSTVSASTTLLIPSATPQPTPTPKPQTTTAKPTRAPNAGKQPPTLINAPSSNKQNAPQNQTARNSSAPNSTASNANASNNPANVSSTRSGANAGEQSLKTNAAANNAPNGAPSNRGETRQAFKITSPHVTLRSERYSDVNLADGTFVYRLILSNDGGSAARDIVVNENLSEGLQYISSEPRLTPQDVTKDGRRIIWRVSELAPNRTAILMLRVRLNPGFTTEHTLTYRDANGNPYSQR
jgi:uncharacterized repeat protein (TIGR01451 family)